GCARPRRRHDAGRGDAVAAVVLRGVERGVRAGEQLLLRLGPVRMGYPTGEGWQASPTALESSDPQDALARAHARFRCAGDDDGDLVAADPEDVLVRADGPHEDARQGLEHLVPAGMAAGVVHGLEVVDVQQGDCYGALVAGLGEHLLEV